MVDIPFFVKKHMPNQVLRIIGKEYICISIYYY